MGGLRWLRRALPSYFIGPVGLLWLTLLLNNPGYRPMGESGGDVFVVRCPYDGYWRTGPAGGVTCEECRNRFVVAPCRCKQPGAAAVGRPYPANTAFESWRCRTCEEFFFAHLCPQCRTLASSLGDGTWQCPKNSMPRSWSDGVRSADGLPVRSTAANSSANWAVTVPAAGKYRWPTSLLARAEYREDRPVLHRRQRAPVGRLHRVCLRTRADRRLGRVGQLGPGRHLPAE